MTGFKLVRPAGKLVIQNLGKHKPGVDFIPAIIEDNKINKAVLHGIADDGLIWGLWSEAKLTTSWEATGIGARLRTQTLQSLRIFNQDIELRIWRNVGWIEICKAVEVEQSEESQLIIQEDYPLFSNGTSKVRNGYTILESRSGEIQAAPIITREVHCTPRLLIYQYFGWQSENLCWKLNHTRWVDLSYRHEEDR